MRSVLTQARLRARRAGLPFDLKPEDLHWPEVCPVLGIPLDGATINRSGSIDRLVPKRGYVRGNVRVISFRANVVKKDATSAELRAIADWMDAEIR